MTAAIWTLSILSIAEFTFAPVNLWTGRTTANFTRFTGLPPTVATRALAPAKLAAAVLIAAGLVWSRSGAAGAAAALAISLFYLARLAHPRRRAVDGVAAFTLFGALAGALLVLQLAR